MILVFDPDGLTKKQASGNKTQELESATKHNLYAVRKSEIEENLIFGSHSFHEVTMAYPMRYARYKKKNIYFLMLQFR